MKFGINEKNLPLLMTLIVCVLLYAGAAIAFYQYNFVSLPTLELLFSSKAPLGIIAVGMTFVILSGGIDLSVGSVMALSTMIVGMLVAKAHAPAWIAIVAALTAGAAIGLLNGCLIQFFEMPPFLVTLGTLFLARGIALVMNHTNRIALDTQTYPFFDSYTSLRLNIGIVSIYLRSIVLIALVILGVIVSRTTRFGRNIYALGGGEQASTLMGLPVARTKILVYTISGMLAALAGVIMLSDSPAGDPTIALGWELDAIAAVVIGGTLLTGGVGSVAGTLLGVIIIALIEQIMTNWGADPSRARIINGLLLFGFIALQKFLPAVRRLSRAAAA
jgi:ribose/xylose/arabinose/galactoside ABC-type transport system permease subunit